MEDIIVCPICLVRFDTSQKEPRLLPCQHNVCLECLVNLKTYFPKSSSLKCPKCRKTFSSKLESLPKSLMISQLIDLNICQAELSQNISKTNNSVQDTWNPKAYLKLIFDQIDINGDGAISANELQKVLKNVNSKNQFDPKTVFLLIKSHDLDGDNQISFDEFLNLHSKLNEDWETFLITDTDSSGGIDSNELSKTIQNKGYSLSKKFFEFFFDKFFEKTGKKNIEFDMFIRVSARLEYLLKYYHNNTNCYRNFSIESYLEKKFFQEFF